MPRVKFLLPSQSPIQFKAKTLDQEYAQRIDLFPPAPKNTPSDVSPFALGDSNALLVSLSQPKDVGGAIGEFTATFSHVPASWTDYKEMPVTFASFPGYAGATPNAYGRDAFTDVVSARVVHDYFVLDADNIISTCSAGHPATSSVVDTAGNLVNCVFQLGDIPIIQRHFCYLVISGAVQPTQRVSYITPVGGTLVVYSGGQTLSYYQTLPSLAHYQAWITNALSLGWASTVWDGVTDTSSTIGQIIPEDSRIQPYSGTIIERTSTYVLAR